MVSQEILNYVIIRKIGEGGMGQVFLAKNRSIHQFVAIKMLHPRFGGSPELRERFRQEAIMLSSLDHPNIVKFLNYVENEQGVFLIMEYVDGMTLEDFINRKNGLIVEDRAYPMMLSIIDAFSYAHSRGIVHRDIKPGNILIGRDGTVKILDFGIAQIVSESDDRDLRGGTVSYMSPEQTLDRPLDIRSDIYSLGVLFWQMLTGRAPYDESELSAFEIKKRIQEQPLPPMKKAYSYISDAIQEVVDRATAKSPEDRYRNCRVLGDAVRVVSLRTSGEAHRGEPSVKPGRGRRIAVGVALSVLALCGAGAAVWWFYGRDRVRYYADYVESHEIPTGIHPLSDKEARSRGSAYRFEYSGGRVARVSHVGAADTVVAVSDSLLAMVRFPDIKYTYASDGSVFSKDVYGLGKRHELAMTFLQGVSRVRVDRIPADGSSADSVSTYYYELRHDQANGRRVSALMTDSAGSPVCGADSVFGYGYAYDAVGRIRRLTYLGADMKARPDSLGIAYVGYDYDSAGTSVKACCYDADGKPAVPVAKVPVAETAARKKARQKKNGVGQSKSGVRKEIVEIANRGKESGRENDMKKRPRPDVEHRMENITDR